MKFLRGPAHVASFIIPVALAVFVLSAQSQPPTPTPTKAGQEPQQAGANKSPRPETDSQQPASPPVGSPLPQAPISQPITSDRSDQEERISSKDWWTLAFTGMLTLVAVFQWIAMLRQSRHMRYGLDETRRAADAAVKNADAALKNADAADTSAAIATQTLSAIEVQAAHIGVQAGLMREGLVLTKQAADAASDSVKIARDALHTVERAYVSMSHYNFNFSLDSSTSPHSMKPFTKIKISNTGRTPARITDVRLITGLTSTPPDKPPYSKASITEATESFLAADDHFDLRPELDSISVEEWHAIDLGQIFMVIVGYVDYIDRFTKRHRAGYGRIYGRLPTGDLGISFVRKPGYNYDRERKRGEGNDWDEPAE